MEQGVDRLIEKTVYKRSSDQGFGVVGKRKANS